MARGRSTSQKWGSLSQAWKCGCANEWCSVAGGVFKGTEWAIWMGTREESQKERRALGCFLILHCCSCFKEKIRAIGSLLKMAHQSLAELGFSCPVC